MGEYSGARIKILVVEVYTFLVDVLENVVYLTSWSDPLVLYGLSLGLKVPLLGTSDPLKSSPKLAQSFLLVAAHRHHPIIGVENDA